MNRLDVPVFLGADKPLVKEYVDALDTHGEDGLGKSFLPEIEGYTQNINALEFYENTLTTTKCSVIALGPLTNLAQLAQKNVKAFDQIEEIVSMGGSISRMEIVRQWQNIIIGKIQKPLRSFMKDLPR